MTIRPITMQTDGERDITVELPLYTKVLSCTIEGYNIAIWAMSDDTQTQKEPRRFIRVGVSTDVFVGVSPTNMVFIDTVLSDSGTAHHIFEVVTPR